MSLPVTVIGGYLGAGKTSLVNHLLRNAGGRRLAVLVNEFGTLPIDADLIEAREGDVIAIAGGCVCCAYGDDMARALKDIAARAPRPDHVLLEASGVALPGTIASTVGLLPGLRAAGIVVLADAAALPRALDDPYMGDTVARQLRSADLVVLNKTDLVPDTGPVEALVSARAPQAQVIHATHGAAGPAQILADFRGVVREAPAPHAVALCSVIVRPPRPADPHAIARALADPALGLHRAKGFVTGPDGTLYELQLAGGRAEVRRAEAAGVRSDAIVCIGSRATTDAERITRVLSRAAHVSRQPGDEPSAREQAAHS